jgi:hypothetical protein
MQGKVREDERFMSRKAQGNPGKQTPLRPLPNPLVASTARTVRGDGPRGTIASVEAYLRLGGNEGSKWRELKPCVNMNRLAIGGGFDYLNAWSARKRMMVNPSGLTANSLFFTCSRKT